MAYCIKCKGVLNFVVNGRTMRLQSDGDVTILVSRQNRSEAHWGEFTMEERNPKVVATLLVPIDMYVSQIQELCDVAMVVELCDGRAFSTDHASNISQDPYDAKTNLQPVEMICDVITELLPMQAAA